MAFHRVIDGFILQGGYPTESGRSHPGYKFANEFHPDLRHKAPGVFSMANADSGTNGMDVVLKITSMNNTAERDSKFNEDGDKITSIEIHDDTTVIFGARKDDLEHWNSILDR